MRKPGTVWTCANCGAPRANDAPCQYCGALEEPLPPPRIEVPRGERYCILSMHGMCIAGGSISLFHQVTFPMIPHALMVSTTGPIVISDLSMGNLLAFPVGSAYDMSLLSTLGFLDLPSDALIPGMAVCIKATNKDPISSHVVTVYIRGVRPPEKGRTNDQCRIRYM